MGWAWLEITVLAVLVGLVIAAALSRGMLPWSIAFLRLLAAIYLGIFKRFRVVGAGYIPAMGPVILIANHTSAYDPVCLQVACPHRLIRWMQAREYYNKMPVMPLYRMLGVIPVIRTGNDTASVRTALRALAEDGCIGIFPEGRISNDGRLQEVRTGAALLALMSGAAVIPAYFQWTQPFAGMVRDFLTFNRVTLHFGPAIRLDDLGARHRDPQVREIAARRIVEAIVSLRDHAEAASHPATGVQL